MKLSTITLHADKGTPQTYTCKTREKTRVVREEPIKPTPQKIATDRKVMTDSKSLVKAGSKSKISATSTKKKHSKASIVTKKGKPRQIELKVILNQKMKKRKNHKFKKLLYPKPLSFVANEVNPP